MLPPISIQFTYHGHQPDEEHLLARIGCGSQQIGQPSLCENWLSTEPVQHTQSADVTYAGNDKVLFGEVRLEQGLPLDQMTQSAYEQVLSVLAQTPCRNLIRVWHYLPGINAPENQTSRYRLFCRGRNAAFANINPGRDCAATVIGTDAHNASMFFIAAQDAGVAVSNANQTQPWEYPEFSASDKPTFARAVVSRSLQTLFMSGTASIVGSQSVYVDDVVAQTEQIFSHFDTLIKAANVTSAPVLEYIKVYVKNAADVAEIKLAATQAARQFGLAHKQIVFLKGEVCRPELALEIETMVQW